MKFSIIVVNYNGKRWLDKNLLSFIDQDFPSNNYEIILVDNTSDDGSYEYVKEKYKGVKIVKSENKGFGHACNLAASVAKGEYLMFFNEDIYVSRGFISDYDKKITSLLSKDDCFGTAGCSIWDYYGNETPQTHEYGAGLDLLAIPTTNFKKEKHFYNAGCPMLVKNSVFKEVGGFCENIFLYSEDLDLCWRMRLYGYNHYFFEDIKIFHYGGGVIGPFSAKKLSNYIRGELNCIWNNYSTLLLLLIIPLYTLFYFLIMLVYLLALKPKYSIIILQTLYKFYFKEFRNVLIHRRIVQSKRLISDVVILKRMYIIPSRLRNLLMKI